MLTPWDDLLHSLTETVPEHLHFLRVFRSSYFHVGRTSCWPNLHFLASIFAFSVANGQVVKKLEIGNWQFP